MKVLLFLVVYLPLQEFILKWLPVGDIGYSLLRQAPDLLVFGLMGLLMLERLLLVRPISIIGGRVDFYLLLFILLAFATLLLNPGADVFLGVANIKALLRYVLLIYIILLLNPNEGQIDKLVRWFWLAITIQLFVGLFQLVGGISARDFLSARSASEGLGGIVKDFTGNRFEDRNDLMGTMGDTISYAYFLMIGFVFWILKKPRKVREIWFVGSIFIALIYLSGSKSVFVTSIMVLMGYLVWQYGYKRLLVWCVVVLPLLMVFAWATISVDRVVEAQANTSQLMEGMMNSRLGIIVYILPELFLSGHNIIGFSPDKYVFTEFVTINFPMVPAILIAVLPYVIEDVYWVAMYVYYGLFGFVCWLLFLFHVYKRVKCSINLLRYKGNYIAMVAVTLLLTSIPLNLLNQAFEARTFSFYLWLFCGIALVQRRRAIKERVES